MPSDSKIHVLILLADAQLRERAAGALAASDFIVWTDRADMPDGHRWQVLVTDLPMGERPEQGPTEQGTAGVIGIGTVAQVDAELPADFRGRELGLAVRLVSQLAELRLEWNKLAEAHSAVCELAETDSLTGLPNRRAWERLVPAILAAASRSDQPAWLALVDLDGFKQINDLQGMSRGDRVLATSAQSLVAALRRDDLVARLGGDEFGILLVGVGDDRVLEIFDRLRASVAAAGAVTASIGLTQAGTGQSEAELMAAAEGAMRAAKRAGGDRTVRAD